MDTLKDFTKKLILGLVKNTDAVSIQNFKDDDGAIILEIIVDKNDIGNVIGKSGATVKALRVLVNACAFKLKLPKVMINIDSI